jgi:hypothetical protein
LDHLVWVEDAGSNFDADQEHQEERDERSLRQ